MLAACGDDGAVGGGGEGGGDNMTTSSSSATSGSVSIATGAGGGDPGPQPCVLAEAEDRTGETSVTITSEGVKYTPRCVRVSAGTDVTFLSNFDAHPLRGGAVVDEQGVVDPMSPITPQDSGTTATFTLTDVGEVPFFCAFHASIGMFGTIWVE
jgi:plastocyanin